MRKDNLSKKWVLDIKYAISKGFDCLKINKAHMLGRFKKNKKYLISEEEYDDIIKQFNELSSKYHIEIELPREKYFNKKSKFLCSAGKKTIYIAPNGDVFPCSFIPKKFLFGKMNRTTFSKIILNNKSFSVDNFFAGLAPQ